MLPRPMARSGEELQPFCKHLMEFRFGNLYRKIAIPFCRYAQGTRYYKIHPATQETFDQRCQEYHASGLVFTLVGQPGLP